MQMSGWQSRQSIFTLAAISLACALFAKVSTAFSSFSAFLSSAF
jgi:hypothetical protein